MEEYKIFCNREYYREYNDTYRRVIKLRTNNNGSISPAAANAARLFAQRKAMDKVFIEAIIRYPSIRENEIWKAIATTHKIIMANLSEFSVPEDKQEEVIKRCISAHQSWIKAGGHSFERYISNIDSEELRQNEIRLILQAELTSMIKNKQLSNTQTDIQGLKAWGKDFDLYAIQKIHGKTYVFGCIQSKTSIRDRVGRDLPFSKNAMESLFWSAAVTLDGSFLNMDEFISMVNGGGSYTTNGWHGMYAMSGISKTNDRIYKDSDTLQLFIQHTIEASRQFISDRRLLNHRWKAPTNSVLYLDTINQDLSLSVAENPISYDQEE